MTKCIIHHGHNFKGIGQLSIATQSGLQIFDLKQMADMEGAYKKHCLQALREYKQWRTVHSQQTDMITMLYGNLEGIMLRRRAEDMVQAYWIIRRDFRRGFDEYLTRHSCYPSQTISKQSV